MLNWESRPLFLSNQKIFELNVRVRIYNVSYTNINVELKNDFLRRKKFWKFIYIDQLNIISTEVSEKKNFMWFFILKIWIIDINRLKEKIYRKTWKKFELILM
jgi:hypothetical protein